MHTYINKHTYTKIHRAGVAQSI